MIERIFHRSAFFLTVLVVLTVISGCSFSKRMAVNMSTPIIEDINNSFNRNPDLQLMKDSMPFTLNGLSGLLSISPKNKSLLVNASQAYFAYTFSFVEDEDPARAKRFYIIARDYALQALFREPPSAILDMPIDEFKPCVDKLDKGDVPAMFWASVAWLSYINLNLGDMSVYLEIPKAEMLFVKLLEEDENYYFGGPHLIIASYYSAQPEISGGKPEKAKKHFEKALELSQGKFLMNQLFYARFYAVRKQDKDLFLTLLKAIMDAPEDILPDYCAITNVCKMKAKRLMAEADDFF